MDDKAKKVMLDIVKGLIDKDYGAMAAVQILVSALIEMGSLDKKLILAKIDEAAQIFERDNVDENIAEAILNLGNSIAPGRYRHRKNRDLVSLLENWEPSGSKH